MPIISREKDENIEDKLSVSKKVFNNLSYNLQLLSERVMSCVDSVDSSEIEEVEEYNKIVGLLNELIGTISENQQTKLNQIDFLYLTDDLGNLAEDFKLFVVGHYYLEEEKEKYYKCRVVNARTSKEALYKYKKEYQTVDTSVACFGLYDEELEYNRYIEEQKVID